MNNIDTRVISKAENHIKGLLSGECTGHDWFHTQRVLKLARKIAIKENEVNHLVLELAAILHDIDDWKFNKGNVEVGANKAKSFLETLNLDDNTIAKVVDIIENSSFKGANVSEKKLSIEGQILQDADRLDAMGAIGIARAFAYGGYRGQEIYNPEIKPKMHNTFEEYKNSKTTTINHFYEKLLLLEDKMNTKTGKKLARKRQKFMKIFLKQFYKDQM